MAVRTGENASRVERRLWPLGGIAVRAAAESDKPTISGYAAVFGELSMVLDSWWDSFRERIERGAFASSIADDDVRALWNHNPDFPIGRIKNGTLSLWEDDRGLAFKIMPPATQLAQDFATTIRDGYVDAMSFGFTVLDEEWDEDAEGQLIRTLKKIKLYEVSPVTFPAYPQTEAQVRSVLGAAGIGDMPQIPARLRRAGAGNQAEEQAQALLQIRRRRLDLLKG